MIYEYFVKALSGTYIVLIIELIIFAFFIVCMTCNNEKLPYIESKWRVVILFEIVFNIIFIIGVLEFSKYLDKTLPKNISYEIYKLLSKIIFTIGNIICSLGQIWLNFFKLGIKWTAKSEYDSR